MPILSLAELEAILKEYAKGSKKEKYAKLRHTTPHLVGHSKSQSAPALEFGSHAKTFMATSIQRYQEGLLSPPLIEHHVELIYQLLMPLNYDICGNKKGSAFEQQHAINWEQTWLSLIAELRQEGQQLSDEDLEKVQQEILCVYRQKIIQLSVYKPKGQQSLEMDEIRVQEYLINISNCMPLYSSADACTYLYYKYLTDFENNLWLDMQTLSRYLNMNQRTEYLKKFEEILARKTVEFLGVDAMSKLFNEMSKDKEFLKALPLLIEESTTLRKFINDYPDKKKKDEVLTASMYEIFNNKENTLYPYQDKHFLIQSMMQKTSVN